MTRERRREPRVPADLAVTVRLLSGAPEPLPARIVEMSGSGLLLISSRPLPVSAPVRIEGGDMLLLGEVCRCESEPGAARVAVQVRHSLRGLRELDRLNRALLGESRVREAAAVETSTA